MNHKTTRETLNDCIKNESTTFNNIYWRSGTLSTEEPQKIEKSKITLRNP